jgi:hypothetical protein
MEEINNNLSLKELEEINLLKEQQKSLRRRFYFDIVKYLLMAFGAGIVFMVVQKPESFLKIKATKEEILRERAKMIIELLKQDDPEKISQGIEAIKGAYPSDENDWLNNFKISLDSRSDPERIKAALKQYTALTKKNENYIKELNRLKKAIHPPQKSLPKFRRSPSVGGASPKREPHDIEGRIQELEREIKANNYIISKKKAYLEAKGISIIETKKTKDWEGQWTITWEGDYTIYYSKDKYEETKIEPLIFEFEENGLLVGRYSFKTKDNRIIKGEIKNIQIFDNCLKGNYYEKGSSKEEGTGTVEFLMFPGKKEAFIGRYKRLKSNFAKVDDNYKIWLGKRLDKSKKASK